MNSLLISGATLLYPGHPQDGNKVDVHIQNGIVEQLALSGELKGLDVQIIDAKEQFLSPGFFDLNVNFGEPGLESKEDIRSGCAAAIAGGFTAVAVHPNTQPPIDRQAEVSFIVGKGKDQPVDVYPIGTISKGRNGEALAELYDMSQAGAIGFSDGDKSVQQAGLMSRALLYAKGFDGVVFSWAEDHSVAGDTKMNEGVMSTYLGMKGNPNLSEALMVSRDLYLAEYNDAPIHFSTISTAESVELIRKAKRKGIAVTCDVAAHHLVLTDESVAGFDSNFKVSPPLRTKTDVKALVKGLKDGTIDAVVSQHTPQEVEYKNVEFHIANNGIIGLQTVLPLLLKAGIDVTAIVEKLAIRPRQIARLTLPPLEKGSEANVVLFDVNKKWVLNEKTNHSKSANSPFWQQELQGQVTLAINKRQTYIVKD